MLYPPALGTLKNEVVISWSYLLYVSLSQGTEANIGTSGTSVHDRRDQAGILAFQYKASFMVPPLLSRRDRTACPANQGQSQDADG